MKEGCRSFHLISSIIMAVTSQNRELILTPQVRVTPMFKYMHPDFMFFFKFCNVYLFLRQIETEHEQGRGRKRGRHRIQSGLQALSCQHRSRRGARIHRPWDHDLSQSRTLNRLSHPGAPPGWIFKVIYRCVYNMKDEVLNVILI